MTSYEEEVGYHSFSTIILNEQRRESSNLTNKDEPHKRKAWYVDAVSSGDKPGREKLGASYAMSTPPPQQRLI